MPDKEIETSRLDVVLGFWFGPTEFAAAKPPVGVEEWVREKAGRERRPMPLEELGSDHV